MFFFTNDAKTKEFARFTMRKDQVGLWNILILRNTSYMLNIYCLKFALQVLYIISDPKFPAPKHLLDHTKKEQEFMAEYLERTGIQWRHYFGPNGPRPPPSLFMWPASQIGQVHSVTSTEGYW